MDGTNNFLAHFKMPKVEINKLRKDYKDSLKEGEKYQDIGNMKDFVSRANDVFDFFEEITGKKVNREIAQSNLFHWFDENYDPPEMKDYIRSQMSKPYFQEHPERLTISNLFPVSDKERMNVVWDILQHYFSLRTKVSRQASSLEYLMKCGHLVSKDKWLEDPSCDECILTGNVEEIIQSPYRALKILNEDSEFLKEIASWFTRHDTDKSVLEYNHRTWPKRLEIFQCLGKTTTNPSSILDKMGVAK